jgi:hypothetical protein
MLATAGTPETSGTTETTGTPCKKPTAKELANSGQQQRQQKHHKFSKAYQTPATCQQLAGSQHHYQTVQVGRQKQ